MNEFEILFVTCVNDDVMYGKCKEHLNALHVPPGYTKTIFPVYGANSMAEGYNRALCSEAKYKVYLHQDAWIINANFIYHMLDIFQKDTSVGLLGVAGVKEIPSNGVWWEGAGLVGKVLTHRKGVYGTLTFEKEYSSEKLYQEVEALDGLLMATCYDIRWREDLFDGFHFYDTSQCVEFLQQGYKVGVINQLEPWCIHEWGDLSDVMDYQRNCIIFLGKYGAFIKERRG